MVAGVLRLGAYGREDLYLTYNPEITFFKCTYKRHTFFAMECIDQNFITPPKFGGTYSCILHAHGDMLSDLMLRVRLPAIPFLPNEVFCKWVDSVACVLVKKVEFEVNGTIISTLSGDWIRVWMELTGHRKYAHRTGSHKRGLDAMISVPSQEYSASQDSYTLYLPLPFWFCKSPGQAFPISAINNHEVRVNVEFSKLLSALQYGPLLYIHIKEDVCFFKSGDIIYQESHCSNFGLFFWFDSNTQRIYYNPILGTFHGSNTVDMETRLLDPQRYLVFNKSGIYVTPTDNNPTSRNIDLSWFLQQRFTLSEVAIMAQYIFLSSNEKRFFLQRRQEYVIEQLQEYSLQSLPAKADIPLQIRRSCSELIWVARLQSSSLLGKPYKFTSCGNEGLPLLCNLSLIINSDSLYNDTSGAFYGSLQAWSHHTACTSRLPGIYTYSFAINPDNAQPSGTMNMSKVEKSYLHLEIVPGIVGISDTVDLRIFARTYNTLVVQEGVALLLF
jgi:hypothetical protein